MKWNKIKDVNPPIDKDLIFLSEIGEIFEYKLFKGINLKAFIDGRTHTGKVIAWAYKNTP